MNLQLGHAGDDLHSITNMWHRMHTVATISCCFSSSSTVNHERFCVNPPDVLIFLSTEPALVGLTELCLLINW